MGKKDFRIILTIVIFCTSVYGIWKLLDIPAVYDRFEDFVLSNKSYAKKIKIETHYMTSEQVAVLFQRNIPSALEDSSHKLGRANQSLYLVICLKNIGDRTSSGVLSCQILDCEECEIHTGPLQGNRPENYVLPTHYTASNPPSAEPTIKWKALYTFG